MKTQKTITASPFQKFVSVIFVTMTLVFLTVPYAMSRHPGEPLQQPVIVQIHHLD
ncbi:hypothetical protein [Propionivibrio sp.]|uniref:hypothetical protein n=1 Tax=Propionivibrio sp. TaxID=2212460 RepID=UPI003BEF8994